jgi:membrane protein implicated in regulation of membrane protease activity
MLASVSLALPWLGVGLCLGGLFRLSRGEPMGGWLLLAGLATFIADIAIDFVWAHPDVSKSDQPDLNQRAGQLVGRVLVLAEAIEGGRGRVRVGDTLWQVEGPDLPCGAEVKVAAAKATLLQVERVDP